MEKVCDIVGDLLPLYLDHVCSDESRRLVEEHIGECYNCGLLLERMQAGWPEETVPPQKGEEVLREAAWSISKWALGSAAGITAIVLYRLVYLWQDILAASGDYRNFSYGFHEVYTIGSLLVPVLTLIWLAVLLRRTAKKHAWRKNAALAAVLAVLLAGQAGYLYQQSRLVHTTCWTEVVDIPDACHIVIQSGEDTVTLESPPLVAPLLKTDGTVYGFYYERDRSTPDRGRLNAIWDAVD
ncbi:MAG: zf-HC2 domain-containing protein [Oscillospiraceae bacterium]|nr:zf-HC2 domain-containing protein [Oscillospiraceae bacterium]